MIAPSAPLPLLPQLLQLLPPPPLPPLPQRPQRPQRPQLPQLQQLQRLQQLQQLLELLRFIQLKQPVQLPQLAQPLQLPQLLSYHICCTLRLQWVVRVGVELCSITQLNRRGSLAHTWRTPLAAKPRSSLKTSTRWQQVSITLLALSWGSNFEKGLFTSA